MRMASAWRRCSTLNRCSNAPGTARHGRIPAICSAKVSVATGDDAKAKAAFERVDQSAEAAELVFLRLQAQRALGEIAFRAERLAQGKALPGAGPGCSSREANRKTSSASRWPLTEDCSGNSASYAAARQHLREAADLLDALGTMIEPDRIRQELRSLDAGDAMTQARAIRG